jgi:hypothetical protein
MEVDPMDIPQAMTPAECEYWILFGICVANKPAGVTQEKMRKFMGISVPPAAWSITPFGMVKVMIADGSLYANLHMARFGQYDRIYKAMAEAAKIDVRALGRIGPRQALKTLLAVPGIGPKTARMVLMYAFPHHANLWVPLDVHVLKWLRAQGYEAPKSTPPPGRTYDRLELEFLKEAKARGMTARDLDTLVWRQYARP